MKNNEPNNSYLNELRKFVNKDVIITFYILDEIKVVKGVLKGLNFSSLSLVLMTDKKKIILKNIVSIERDRSYVEENGNK